MERPYRFPQAVVRHFAKRPDSRYASAILARFALRKKKRFNTPRLASLELPA
jgi:hypothetical protein